MVAKKYTQLIFSTGHSTIFLFYFLTFAILLNSASDTLAQNRAPDKTIEINAIAGLRYDKVRFVVKPGASIKIIMENTDDMMHNLLIVNPGTREQIIREAEAMGEHGLENDFVPQSPDVLASIPILDPGEKASVLFQVPDEEGAYPFVCTYSIHGLIMYGVMHVTNQPDLLPPVEEDPDVPEMIRKELWMSSGIYHPYPAEMPQVTRLFMPESSPAAIAVGMEGNQSYCWDAGVCHLRYAWTGGYIDPSEQWDAKSTEFAKIMGEIYYKDKTGFPFRIVHKDSIPKPEFRGYQLIDDYPQFMYTIGGIKVHELIKPAETGPGLEIKYNFENVNEPVWYKKSDGDNIKVEASGGEWEENLLRLSPEQAKEFTISIISE